MKKILAIDSECTGLFIHKGCQAFTISACCSANRIYLWHFHVDPMTRKVKYPSARIKEIKSLIAKHDTLVFHNANYDLQVLQSMGISWTSLFEKHDIHDTMIMSHAYRSSDKHGLKENAVLYLGYPDDDEKALSEITKKARLQARKLEWRTAEKDDLDESLVGTQKEHFRCDYWIPKQMAEELGYPSEHPWRHTCDTYAGKDAERTLGLYYFFDEVLHQTPNTSLYENHTGTLYDKYDEARKLIYPILDMQAEGIPVKPRALKEAQSLFATRQADTLSELRRLSALPDFNPRSPTQLASILFHKYRFPVVKNGKTGPSTDKDVIAKLMSSAKVVNNRIPDKYKFLVALKEYRKETTTLQYINNYYDHSAKGTRPIQPFFSQTRTGTGRLSCTDPNTTNVGKKDMSNPFADDKDKVRATLFSEILGIETDHRFSLRNVFGPRHGELWTCIDYDQFQLRIFAVVSESYDLLEGFERGDDIHTLVARIIFNKEDISDVERTAAKAINFGLLFGAGPDKIELLAGVPGLYRIFMDNFPKAKLYLDVQSRLARSKGYVHTVGGYRLYVPYNAPHAASCYVIQGTEAEIVKRAMVGVHSYLNTERTNAATSRSDKKTISQRSTGSESNNRRGNSTNNNESLLQRSTRVRPRLETQSYKLLMMVHDELVFTSKIYPFTIKDKDATPSSSVNFNQLHNIMNIMETAGTDIGIPCKVDAKITSTDWSNRHSLILERQLA